ncbi:MAG: FAD-binding oxidoreductase [Pseudomonadota bacterium]
MKRIYPDHAYGEAPRADCYWPTTVTPETFPPARGELVCDVAIIGAGFTGLAAAVRLAEDGERVIVLEAEQPGWGASGRNGGFCCLGGAKAGDTLLRKMYGEDGRREWRQAEVAAVENARSLIETHGVACDRHSEGETLMAHTARAAAGYEAYAQSIEDDYGVTPTVLSGDELAQNGLNGPFYGAITNPIGFALNPIKFALGLGQAAVKAGARICGDSPVQRIDQAAGQYELRTDTATVTARRLVVATNGYSSDDVPAWMRGRYLPTQSNVIVTREMTDAEIAEQGWSSLQMCFDDQFFLHYFRLMPNNRMLFGMRGGLRSSAAGDRAINVRIRKHFETMFPAWAKVETPHRWNGLLSISPDLTPYAGPIPGMKGAVTGLSYHGNGVSMASYSGTLLADLVRDRVPDRLYPKVMQRAPGRFTLGSARRAYLWALYGWAALTGD